MMGNEYVMSLGNEFDMWLGKLKCTLVAYQSEFTQLCKRQTVGYTSGLIILPKQWLILLFVRNCPTFYHMMKKVQSGLILSTTCPLYGQ